VKTAQQAAQNWASSQGRAATAYQQGVEGYNGDWAGATVSQEANLLANFQQAVTGGFWRAGVQAVGTAGWKSKTVAKVSNYSTGFSAGAADQAAAITKIMNALSGIVGSLPPRGTFEQNKARATFVMDSLHALRGTLGAR
jgi:hypothetical protein